MKNKSHSWDSGSKMGRRLKYYSGGDALSTTSRGALSTTIFVGDATSTTLIVDDATSTTPYL